VAFLLVSGSENDEFKLFPYFLLYTKAVKKLQDAQKSNPNPMNKKAPTHF